MIHQQCALLFLSRNDNVLKQYLLSVHSAFGLRFLKMSFDHHTNMTL